ncbi:hypothetical protein [Flavobacterium sp.]|uniref:hypothetical protein n=1 Tax=Flavobacterium sp. TaxID=239 RepID=UPI0031D6CD76
MKKVIFLTFLLIVISCNSKKDEIKKSEKVENVTTDVGVKSEFNTELFKVNHIYKGDSYNFIQLTANYNIGNFVYNEEFEKCLVDTLSVKTKKLELSEVLQNAKDYPNEVILIDDFTLATLKYDEKFYVGLFRIIDINNYRCIAVLELEKYKKKESFFDLGDHKLFSYACNTSAGDSCFAIVIDKVNSAGKYDKILKAVKFDLVNEKIIEIDLTKEKIECLPENES